MQTIDDILKMLTEETTKLRENKSTPEHANSVARLTQVYLNTLKMEVTAGVKIAAIIKK